MSCSHHSFLPSILDSNEDDVLVPIKIDLADKNGRYVDSFCWNIYNPLLTPEEFAWKTCMEENLPSEMIPRIVDQLVEQIEAFKSLIHIVESSGNNEAIVNQLKNFVSTVTIRNNVLQYSDTFQWDAYSSLCSPEDFAKQTCLDLGLPSDMQPVIALRLRESLIRFWNCLCVE